MSKFTNEQVKELIEMAQTEKEGKIINLSYFGQKGKMDTRLNRIEQILPNINNFVTIGEDGKFSPLTEKEKTDQIMKVFNEFWKNHLYFNGSNFKFVGLQDDFFTAETYNRMLNYAKAYFAARADAEIACRNQFKYILTVNSDINILEKMDKAFPKSVNRKMKEISKIYSRRKKEQAGKENETSLLQLLIANNLAWQDAKTSNLKVGA